MAQSGKHQPGTPGKRSGRSRQIAEMVPNIGGAAFRRFGFIQSAVVSRWGEIVGPRFAESSSPESIRFAPGKKDDGVLTVLTEGAFAPFLQHAAPEIIERVNRFFGYHAIARVTIRQGGRARRKVPKVAFANDAPLPVEIGQDLRAIEDDGLRTILESLARRVCASEGPPTFD